MSVPIDTIIDDFQIASEAGFIWREKDGVKVLVCKGLEDLGFPNGFSTRVGGVSSFPENDLNLADFDQDTAANIGENRRKFLKLFPEFRLTSVWQVHGDGVKLVNSQDSILNTEEQFDAMISEISGVLLGVKTADCVPVLIGDPRKRAFAAIHAGWRGTANTIVQATISKMKIAFDSNPADLVCAIGPAAGRMNYEIGQEVIDSFASRFDYASQLFVKTSENHALIDLHRANELQLREAGVAKRHIFIAPYCTMDRLDLFFSYRAENRVNGKSGRMMSVIGAQ